ncbi:MAG TPA: DNA methyltransferase [Methylocella sp.]|jgi:site-specific DNA-methyltransferase (adenine-specific)|nr:DNA methyltransferase [Methylocella sp.]
MNKLYFGDNLDVLREKIKDESVDLIYLDPPFNSDANYNVLFKPGGQASQAQAEAFRDTWDWGEGARHAYEDVMRANGDVAVALSGLRRWLGENAIMAYLAMMAVRLIELHRVLKPTGSLFLHCDPTASHYLKILLDAIFGVGLFQNEIIWQKIRSSKAQSGHFGNVHDVIFLYKRGVQSVFNPQRTAHSDAYILSHYRHVERDSRRCYRLDNFTQTGQGPARLFGDRGLLRPPAGKHWIWSQDRIDDGLAKGLLIFAASGMPSVKRYLDEVGGNFVEDIWTDIAPINSQAKERLGYPTQKPVALLERVIAASSNEGDIVLDPFCGCGTTIHAAQKLDRQWIGIDVTHYAVTLIERRLSAIGIFPDAYQVVGRPTDIAGARDLARRDKHQFQWWAAWRLGARWYREEKKGADRGIDGRMLFKNGPYGDGLIIISVKGGDNVGVQMVRDLRGVIEREEAEMGIFISLAEPTGPMMTEAAAAGFVSKSAHGRLPRLQIVKIEDILERRMPKLPPLPEPERIDRRAPRKQFKDQLELLLPFAGDKIGPTKGDFIDPSIMAIGG